MVVHDPILLIVIVVVAVIATVIVTLIVTRDKQKDIDYIIEGVSEVTSPSFERTVENLIGPKFLAGNQVTAFQNGDEIFPAMLQAIRSAKDTINFESYIYSSGSIGQQFTDALSERASAGVKVRLLVDWAGGHKLASEMTDKMRAAGLDLKFFHPLSWYKIARMNNRTHRKLLIVDGEVGFTGGVGIADEWIGNADSPKHWRDSQFRVEGPVVGQFQAAFADNWLATSPDVFHGERYFPKLESKGASRGQLCKSAAKEGVSRAELLFLFAIEGAKKEILIQSAYFIPGNFWLKVLLKARARGVQIRIIVPGPIIDSPSARHASRNSWGKLLEGGVEIWEYQPTMYHVKAMIVDGAFVSVGSSNFDDRSFRLNSEANLNILDTEFAESLKKVFEDDLKNSRRVTFQEWKNRPLKEKILGWFASLISSQL